MKSFKNDNAVILQQKIIHLGSEVKRLSAELEKVKDKSYLKNLEIENAELLGVKESLEGDVSKLEEKWIAEKRDHESVLEKKKKLTKEVAKYQEELTKQYALISELESHLTINAQKVIAAEKEYKRMKEKVTALEQELTSEHQEKQDYYKAIEINKKLEEENIRYQEKLGKQQALISELEAHLITATQKASAAEKELEKERECVARLKQELTSEHQEKQDYYKAIEINKKLEEGNIRYQEELGKQQALISELEAHLITATQKASAAEKELEKERECVARLKQELADAQQEKQGYNKGVDQYENLEQQNIQFQTEVKLLQEELKSVQNKNLLLISEIARLNECIGNLEKNADHVIHESTMIADLEVEIPASVKIPQKEEKRVQSWFYNNVKKSTK